MKISFLFLFFLFLTTGVQAQIVPDTTIYAVTSEPPVYDGDYYKFLKENLHYPETNKSVSGKIFMKFVVEKDGSISDLKIIKGLGSPFDEEALRVGSLTSGHWVPAKKDGKAVRFYQSMQVEFRYEAPVSPFSPIPVNPDSMTLVFIGEPPVFKEDYNVFLRKNLKYPKDAIKKKIEGMVHIKFVVEKDGSVSNISIVRGVCQSLDEEAIRVVQMTSGKWSIGKNNGAPARCWKNLSITFQLTR